MGKLTEFNIYIHGNRRVFYPGEPLYGEVILNLHKPMEMRGLYLECEGKAECHWTEEHGTGDSRHTEHYHGEEKLFEYKVDLFRPDKKQMHPQGRYAFQFSFTLPQSLPSSFEASHGHIRYQLKAQIDKPWKRDHKVKCPFSVNEIIDVNQPHFRQGPGGEVHKEVGCCCCAAGPLSVFASIDRAAYCPGEVILVNANAQNHTSRDMSALKAKLYRTVSFHSTRKTKTESNVVTRIDGPPITKGQFAVWEKQPFGIPATAPTIQNRVIEVTYHVEVQVDVPWGFDPSVKMPIIMGTVPFRPSYEVPQQFTFTPEQAGLQANFAAVPPPPLGIFGYPDMAPPSYASAIGDSEVNIADSDGKMHGNSSYIPIYTFAQPFKGEIPPMPAVLPGTSYPPPLSNTGATTPYLLPGQPSGVLPQQSYPPQTGHLPYPS